ncbi:cobyrinic acid a,c-diamide synthase [Tessaracoccus antarcticus]|uniref:Cobyrinic acid a,c-diamide synthase n=1 Tax=Tessaracoccus antarcticus TaxID=2479848 RepID=A0A3M0G238_9ACTN|nr:cobyrinic acid a,c-diamide synthase [Tessaracoccus antarcticus]RMB58994.1 cobyrinic acid a,c-diamide synthase [Tessaracoccus antarcticus]
MSKRASLPGAAELFRTTQTNPAFDEPRRSRVQPDQPSELHTTPMAPQSPGSSSEAEQPQPPQASGRVRHDQKITVYFSSEELFALEDATLDCKRRHGLKVDRGRLVRSAVALALADLAERGPDSDVVAALRAQ